MKAKQPESPYGTLDQRHEFDVTLRIRGSGKSEVLRANIARVLERELGFHFSDAEVRRIRRASR